MATKRPNKAGGGCALCEDLRGQVETLRIQAAVTQERTARLEAERDVWRGRLWSLVLAVPSTALLVLKFVGH